MATLHQRLDALTNVQIAEIYNSVSDRKVSKFSDHLTAVKRTESALQSTGMDFQIRTDDQGSQTLVVLPVGERREGDTRLIVVLASHNPKRRGSKSERRFALYWRCPTVGDYVREASKLGGGRRKAIRDIVFDRDHGYIRLD